MEMEVDEDEQMARRLQAEFDEEVRSVSVREKKDAAFAQQLASQSHDLSASDDDDDDDDVTICNNIEGQQGETLHANTSGHMKTTEDEVLLDSNDDEVEVVDTKKQSRSKVCSENVLMVTSTPPLKKVISTPRSEKVTTASPSKRDTIAPPSTVVASTPPSNNVTSTPASKKKRPLCKFGDQCYRKNPWHLEEFYHPHLEGESTQRGSQVLPASTKLQKSSVDDSKTPAKRHKTSSDDSQTPAKWHKSFADDSQMPTKQQESSEGNASSQTNSKNALPDQACNVSKRPFSCRLLASAPFNLFLNKTYSVKGTHGNPLSLVFPDILNPMLGEIVESAQLNFMVDLKFVMDNYKACRVDKKPLLVMYGQLDGNPKDYERVKCTKVNLPYQYGTHHTKMMLLQYTNGLRVVIHTANLVPDDWEEKTQGYWVSPLFPELGDDKSSLLDGESPTRFKRDLVEYVLSYKAPDLTRWSHILKKYDFSDCNMVFIGSTPGYHVGENKDRWGHMKVRRIMRQYAASWKNSLPIIAQCSSIGSLGKDAKTWLSGELGMSLTGAPGVCASPPMMKVVYPSESDIQNSSQGWMGGSCLPYNSETHAKQEWMRQHFHLWKSEKRRRTRAMPHIKTYTRLNKEHTKAQFLLLTSANLSKAAWGMLQKQNSQLFIRSYEAGVLALPKFVTDGEEFVLKSPWKELGFSLPYDVPLTPYPSTAKPWFMNTSKSDKDVFGHTYP